MTHTPGLIGNNQPPPMMKKEKRVLFFWYQGGKRITLSLLSFKQPPLTAFSFFFFLRQLETKRFVLSNEKKLFGNGFRQLDEDRKERIRS